MSKGRKNKITLMIVPHAENPMKTMNLTINLIKVGAVAICFLMLLAAVGIWRFYGIKKQLVIMPELKKINEENKQQIDDTNRQLEEIKEKVKQVEELENQVRNSLGLKKQEKTQSNVTDISGSQLSLLSQREVFSPVQDRMATVSRGGVVRLPVNNSKEASFTSLEGEAEELFLSSASEDFPMSESQLPEQNELDLLKQDLDQQIRGLQEIKTTIARKNAIKQSTPSIRPTNGRISSNFGRRSSPAGRGSTNHEGIDIAAPRGTPIRATADGTVSFSGTRSGYGNVVMINHGNGYVTLYGHNSQNKVKAGQKVKKGQIIALVGSTGVSTGPHVHYEVRVNGRPVDPRKYF
jgi:murein DD-endopeptidase MepM/ murein hydrolase activator NlpD